MGSLKITILSNRKKIKLPYIKLENRINFAPHIVESVDAIMVGAETQYIKGEHFGYLVNRIVKEFIRDPRSKDNSFNSVNFNVAKLARLANCANKISALLPSTDPIAVAGDLNYAISAIYWGISGDAKDVLPASYGVRSYLKGILHKVHDTIETISNGSQRDATMSFRRCLVAKGVVSDIIDECYSVKTRVYEDEKISENQTIWSADGNLLLPE